VQISNIFTFVLESVLRDLSRCEDATGCMFWRSNTGGGKRLFLLRNVQIVSGPHLSSNLSGTGVLSRDKGGRILMLTTHLRLLPRIRMSEAIPLFSRMPSWCT
jgi:hypothetical protein